MTEPNLMDAIISLFYALDLKQNSIRNKMNALQKGKRSLYDGCFIKTSLPLPTKKSTIVIN